MRHHVRLCLLATATLLIAGCGQSESYEVSATDAYGKVLSAAYASGISPLPSGLAANDVDVRFNSIPTDRTAYWSFVQGGKELGRLNVAVSGDDSSSKVSYSYAEGDGAAASEAVARQVKQHMPVLVAEAVDAKIENRPIDNNLKLTADNLTAVALMGNIMNNASAAMDKAVEESEQRRRMSEAQVSKADATRPMMTLPTN